MTNRCGICVLNVSLTLNGMVHKRGGVGLYKPRPNIKTGLVFQVDARVLLRCLSKTKPLPYMVDTCLLPEHIIVGYFQVYFPFFIYSSLWTFFSGTVNKFTLHESAFASEPSFLNPFTDSHSPLEDELVSSSSSICESLCNFFRSLNL